MGSYEWWVWERSWRLGRVKVEFIELTDGEKREEVRRESESVVMSY